MDNLVDTSSVACRKLSSAQADRLLVFLLFSGHFLRLIKHKDSGVNLYV